MFVPEAPAPGTGCAQPSAGCCTATPACMRAMWSSGSGLAVYEGSYSSFARICCYIPVELVLRCCCSCCCLVLSIDGPHLIQDRLQDCLVCCALCYPTSWIDVQEVFPDTGSTTYKAMLVVLALHLVLVRLVFQLNDCDMIPLLPLFCGHFEYICTGKNAIGVVIGGGGS